MKLEAVYLLPPEPDRRMKLSRRSLLGYVVGAFTVGALGGHLVGFWSGDTGEHSLARAVELDPQVELDLLTWAREVATGSIEGLLASTPAYVAAVHRHPTDDVLWSGAERLARHLVLDPRREWSGESDSVRNLLRRSPIAEHAALSAELGRSRGMDK